MRFSSMLRPIRAIAFALIAMSCASPAATQSSAGPPAPTAAYHQHLAGPGPAAVWALPEIFDADDLIAQLDEAGIRRAMVLSIAYIYGDDRRQFADEYASVRAENDWTAAQVSRYPDRLAGFCGISPLRAYALEEIERCSRLPHMIGLKLHMGNSGVNVRNPEHLARLIEVFALANRLRMPIVVHMRSRISDGTPYGREDAVIWLEQILPTAPDIVVQVAHLAGAGPGYPDDADAAMGVFVDAIAARDPRTRNLYFDITTVASSQTTPENGALIAQRIRQVGLHRVLFGADLAIGSNPTPAQAWAIFQERIPLSAAELDAIARNTAPYLR